MTTSLQPQPPERGAVRGACPGLADPMPTGDGLLARLTPRHGIIPLEVLARVLEAARRHGNGVVEVTRRGSLQVRGLNEAAAAAFAGAAIAAGFDEASRPAILLDPTAGADPIATADPRPLADAVRTALEASGLSDRLAAKLTLVIDGGGALGFPDVVADIRFTALPHATAPDQYGSGPRWAIALGGTARDAAPLGSATADEAVPVAMAVIARLAAEGPRARARTLIARHGLGPFSRLALGALAPAVAAPGGEGRDGTSRGGPSPAPIVPGLVYLPFGHTTAAEFAALAAAAAACGATEARLAADHGVLFRPLDPDGIAGFLATAVHLGFITASNDPRRFVSACTGAPGCASATFAARALAPSVAAAAASLLDGSVRLHLSGCSKGCAESAAADLTLVGALDDLNVILSGRADDAAVARLGLDRLVPGLAALARRADTLAGRPIAPMPPPLAATPAIDSRARLDHLGAAAILSALGAEPIDPVSRKPSMPSFDYIRDGAAIYQQSFAIIRAEADLSRFADDEADVAVRMIHAAGMVEAARHFAFSPGAVALARAALQAGAPILCDAQMVAHGVTRARLPADNAVICTLHDSRVADLARDLGTTRSAAALELWRDQLAGAVVAIGNAPTALFHLLEMLSAGAPRPAAIIGMPVGFVGAAESKAALEESPLAIPFLVVRGRLGGSAMTAAALNALARPGL